MACLNSIFDLKPVSQDRNIVKKDTITQDIHCRDRENIGNFKRKIVGYRNFFKIRRYNDLEISGKTIKTSVLHIKNDVSNTNRTSFPKFRNETLKKNAKFKVRNCTF